MGVDFLTDEYNSAGVLRIVDYSDSHGLIFRLNSGQDGKFYVIRDMCEVACSRCSLYLCELSDSGNVYYASCIAGDGLSVSLSDHWELLREEGETKGPRPTSLALEGRTSGLDKVKIHSPEG